MRKFYRKYLCLGCLLLTAAVLFLGCTSVHAAKLPALRVKGTQLVNGKGKKVQLKGVSTHGLSWFPEYVNQKAFTSIKKNWNANAVRLAPFLSAPPTGPRMWMLLPRVR